MKHPVLVVFEFVVSLLFSVCIVSCSSFCMSIKYNMLYIAKSISTLHLSAPFVQQKWVGTRKTKLPVQFIFCNNVGCNSVSGSMYDVQILICNNSVICAKECNFE